MNEEQIKAIKNLEMIEKLLNTAYEIANELNGCERNKKLRKSIKTAIINEGLSKGIEELETVE